MVWGFEIKRQIIDSFFSNPRPYRLNKNDQFKLSNLHKYVKDTDNSTSKLESINKSIRDASQESRLNNPDENPPGRYQTEKVFFNNLKPIFFDPSRYEENAP